MADSKASVVSGGKSSPAGSDDSGPSPVLDLRSAKRQVWMVKVPDYVYDKVVLAQQTGTKVELGALRVHAAPEGQQARMEVLLKRDAEEAGLEAPPPRELLLKTREEHATRHILAEGDDALAIYGIVEQKMDMQAKMGPELTAYLRMRTAEKQDAKKTVLQEDDASRPRPTFIAPRSTTELRRRTRAANAAALENRHERIPREVLHDLIFEAFERYRYWSFMDIVKHTRQPQQYVREALAELCHVETTGQYRSLYALKPEYSTQDTRFSKAEPGASGASEAEPAS